MMRDVSTPGTPVVADRPVKVCPGVEDRSCGKEIPAIRTWCEECSVERRKLKRRGYNSTAYQADAEPRKAKRRARYRLGREREDCKIVIPMTAWVKSEKDRKRDLEFGYVRPLTPRPYPKTFRRLRPPRRRTILDRANALVNEELRRGVERLERHGRPVKNFPYRPPRLRDILPPQPDPAAATTVTTGGQYKTRLYRGKKRGQSKKKRGRPPLTEAQKYKRALRRAVSLYQRVVREKMAPADAWYAVNPESGMSRANATRETQRLIAWLRREHPPTLEERLHLAGLDDLDVICRAIKTFLEANLPATKRLPERANWYIRKKGLELLMRGLGLATWRGFRSGPYAVGGERELEPVERNDVPAGDEDSVADVKRRIKAQSIFFRYQFEGEPLADCWLELTPDSKANRMTAKKEAMKLVDYFEKRYGSSLSERLIANGLDEQVVISTIKALKAAGRADDRDWKITAWGLDMQMVILGFRPPSGRCVPRQAVDVTGMLHGDPDEAALSPEAARRYIATELYKLHFRSGMPLADAWYKLHPGDRNRVSAELASRVAAGELTWFRQAYPMPMVALMEVHGLGLDNLRTGVKEMMKATKKLKVRQSRDERGKIVSKTSDYIDDVPNLRAQYNATIKLLTLLGYGPGGWRQPVAPEYRQERQEPAPPPKTMEEAVERNYPITFIEHPAPISEAERFRQFNEYQAEKKQYEEKYGSYSDEWRARLKEIANGGGTTLTLPEARQGR